MTKYLELLQNTKQDHILMLIEKSSQDEINLLDKQISELEVSYPGGIKEYISRAKNALYNSKNNVNPYADYTPSIPTGFNLNLFDEDYFKYESLGLEKIAETGFVLVAGGLGERLGYPSIKIGIQITLIDPSTYIEYYCNYLKAFQKEILKRFGKSTNIPLCIMTSDDTHLATLEILSKNNNYGIDITIVKQDKVPALLDNDCHLALEKNKLLIETKPHGHGDVHVLVYHNNVIDKWIKDGKKYVVYFQDTNSLAFRAIPSLVGVSEKHKFHMNTMSIPRKPGDAMGALCCLKSNDKELTINVEYNQLDALLKEKYNKDGDIPNEKGYSHFPGNTNVLCFEITKYYEALKKTNGLTPEFINPKYADSTKSVFKSPARLECMMQDFPLLFTNEEKVGFTTYPIWFSFASCKNNLSDGVDKISKGLNAESAFSVEQNIFNCNVKILRKLNLIEIKDRDLTDKIIIHNKEIQIGPKLLIKPSFAVTVYQLRDKIRGNILLSANSTMILDGDEKIEKDLEINGTYKQIGNNHSYKENEFIKYISLKEDEGELTERIRGFKIEN